MVISEITNGGNGLVQDEIRTIQQRISEIESNADGQSIATSSIMRSRSEQADLISGKINHSNDCLVRSVKVKRINSQVTTNGYNIDDSKPGIMAVNGLDTNAKYVLHWRKLHLITNNTNNHQRLSIWYFIKIRLKLANFVGYYFCHRQHHLKFIHHDSKQGSVLRTN